MSTSCGGVTEKTTGINDGTITSTATVIKLSFGRECADGVGESIDGISVVERLGTKSGVENLRSLERITVAYIGIRLDNPDKFLTGVVEVKLNFVAGGSNGFITSELKLFNKVLVGVLCHTSTLIGIKENVVNIEGSSNKRLVVGSSVLFVATGVSNFRDSPEALIKRTELDVNLDLVILKGNKRKGKTGVAAEPELKRNVESSLRKSLAGSADCVGDIGSRASSGDSSEFRVG